MAGCQRVVYASSVNAVLGYEGTGRDGEASGSAWDVPVMPTNVYGATKVRAVRAVHSCRSTHSTHNKSMHAVLWKCLTMGALQIYCSALLAQFIILLYYYVIMLLCYYIIINNIMPCQCWGEALARVFSTEDTHGGLPKEAALSCICVRIGSPRWDPNDFPPPDKLHEPHWGFSPRDCGQLFSCCVDVSDVQFAIVAGISRHVSSWMDVEHSCKVLGYEPQDGTVHAPGARAPAKL
eukprot:SAG31_NODE_514_length_14714_cov_78.431269_6_plen_236_part_00